MSLIDAFSRKFVLIDVSRIPDGEGGTINTYHESVEFTGALTADTTMQAQIAMKQGVTSVYTLTTRRSLKFAYHDIFKDVETGNYYRVTSESGLKQTPSTTTLDISQVTVEPMKEGLPLNE